MATFNGVQKPDIRWRSINATGMKIGPSVGPFTMHKATLNLTPPVTAQVRNPIDVTHWANPAYLSTWAPNAFNHLKSKIIITPQNIDAGLVLAAKQYTAVVWSTYDYWQRMLSWSVVNMDGVDVSNADGQPVNYGPNKSRSYDVTINAAGQASVVGQICWTFQGIAAPCINVTGTRLIAWGFEPNWATKPVETLEWLTDVMQAYNHEEQRVRLRQNPRRSLKYSFTMDGTQKIGLMHNDLYGWMHRVFAVPIWTDWQYLGADYAAGIQTINITTSNLDINAGQLMMIWVSATSNEIIEVNSLTASSISLTKPTNNAWGKMARIIPCRLGRLNKRMEVAYHTGKVIEVSTTFAFEPKTAVGSNRIGTHPYTTLVSGLPLLTLSPEPDVTMPIEKDILTIDAEKGGWYVYAKGDTPSFTTELRWVLSGRAAISNFLAWLEYCKGKLTPFWMPSWQWELELAATVNSTDTSITVKRSDLTKFIGTSYAGRKRLCFINSDGTFTLKTIQSIGESGDNEIILLDSSFGAVRTNDSFRCISFLRYVRLDTDSIEMTWHGGALLECSIPVREIPAP